MRSASLSSYVDLVRPPWTESLCVSAQQGDFRLQYPATLIPTGHGMAMLESIAWHQDQRSLLDAGYSPVV